MWFLYDGFQYLITSNSCHVFYAFEFENKVPTKEHLFYIKETVNQLLLQIEYSWDLNC